jgi:hypothetical protein
MPKKNAPAKKRGKVGVKDLATKANPRGGLTLPTAPTRLTAQPTFQSPTAAFEAKGTDVAMESLILSSERIENP